jgi:nicotinate-nucleotide adenylyltransferase
MNIGLFGGSFDPIHRGHLALAQAAASRYALRQVLFVPANVPPHKRQQPLAAFVHRYAMVALATQDNRRFVPSLLEAPEYATAELRSAGPFDFAQGRLARAPVPTLGQPGAAVPTRANYSIDTVRRVKRTLKKSDRLFFLIGMDAFLDIAEWHEARALLAECDFIVASRPGYSLRDAAMSLPAELQPAAARALRKQAAKGELIFPGVRLHLLDGVRQSVSATAIRAAAAARGKPLARWLDPRVADYVRKHGLYRKGA